MTVSVSYSPEVTGHACSSTAGGVTGLPAEDSSLLGEQINSLVNGTVFYKRNEKEHSSFPSYKK